ncbi:MAG: B12-binding domain-containing radical SAM protein [Acidobacteria bacterium]|nr:B12-binding domain-containing radical SAM protein [Acidobacteriota bacterium]
MTRTENGMERAMPWAKLPEPKPARFGGFAPETPRSPAINLGDPHSFPALGKRIKVLMIWPRFPSSFWGFQGMISTLIPEKTLMPPLGLITVAALCPKEWTIRLIDRAFEDLLDTDILWADLVMVSAMHVQKDDVREILGRARALGKRTMIGGPYASSQPEMLLLLADHVVVGEPDEVFQQIATDLETGTARRLYTIHEKPNIQRTPVPRFDLLKIENYASMSIQFSRGCPFQCEFCDIITLYGRKPRTKSTSQTLLELEVLFGLGWRKPVFIVDDNFIGNHKLALELAQELEQWQKAHDYPFLFYTEASMDLAQRPALLEAMVKANFFFIFIGIESPSKESLREAKKFQNLRQDPLDCIRSIQQRGLWVTGGFIIGFDSDTEDIFERQVEFIELAAIPWAMAGFLQAPPTTPLYDRMLKEGRLIEQSAETSNFEPPNFRTVLPLPVLLEGVRRTLLSIYSPPSFYDRAFRSLLNWEIGKCQRPPRYPVPYKLGVVLRSLWYQGITSSYRKAYWKFFFRLLCRWCFCPQKLWLGFTILLSGQHFIYYAAEVAAHLERELKKAEKQTASPSPGFRSIAESFDLTPNQSPESL